MKNSDLKTAIDKIHSANSVILLSHVRPDGDAYGSELALGLSLKEFGKKIYFFNQDGLSTLFTFLPGADELTPTPKKMPAADLIISLDTSTENRLGEHFTGWSRPVDINIDHHVSNTLYAKINVIDSNQPATASIIQKLIEESDLPMTPQIASNLFVGLTTDTGSFRYRGTTQETFLMAGKLVEAGADPAYLAKECYQSFSPSRFKLNQMAMQNLQFEKEDTFAWFELHPDMFEKVGALPEDTEGIVESTQAVKTVEISALFEYRGKDALKISLRSKGKFNVSEIAKNFGGGGHPGAAGINFSEDAAQYQQKVLDHIRELL
ncbi:MAG: bifunctional oligoribonuclease/PAP phosphatase NrnA [Verrucomicrobiota bacterium]